MDLSDLINQFTGFGPVSVLRGVVGFFLVFFVPGFAWTLVFFRRLLVIERIALAFGLSIALVTLSILFLNVVMKMRITGLNTVLVIIVLSLVPTAIYLVRRGTKAPDGNG